MNLDASLTLGEFIKQQPDIEKILLFHGGWMWLYKDFILKKKSIIYYNTETGGKGYGNSPVLQTSFLFLFDATIYFIQSGNHKLI